MTLRAIFEGIGHFFEWAFGLLKILGSGFGGLGIFNVFWMLVIAAMIVYWIGQMKKQASRGER